MQRAANRVSASLAKVIIQCIILQVVVALSLPRLVCNNNFKTKIQLFNYTKKMSEAALKCKRNGCRKTYT